MKTFHVVWMIGPEMSTGKDIQAENMGEAYAEFKRMFPSVEPLYITSKNN